MIPIQNIKIPKPVQLQGLNRYLAQENPQLKRWSWVFLSGLWAAPVLFAQESPRIENLATPSSFATDSVPVKLKIKVVDKAQKHTLLGFIVDWNSVHYKIVDMSGIVEIDTTLSSFDYEHAHLRFFAPNYDETFPLKDLVEKAKNQETIVPLNYADKDVRTGIHTFTTITWRKHPLYKRIYYRIRKSLKI
jgi:hypothetical protein